jgi:PAS domain S-box-containing protein
MNWNYAYTPQIWPSVLMAVLMITLSVYSGRRRSVPGATPLMITSLLAAAWAAGSLFETAAVDLATKIIWFKVQAVIQLPIVTGITCFILEYTWPGRWLTRRNLAWLSLPILLFIGMMLTNARTHLIWRSFSMLGTLRPEQGPGSWLMAIYFLLILEILNLIVLGWLFLHSPQHRWPVVLMLIGQLTGRTLFLMDRFQTPNSVVPLDLLGMSFEFLAYALALFSFRILDPIPLARQTAIQQLRTGMLVLDLQGRVVSLNPATSAFLGLPSKRLLGSSIQDLLPAYTDLAGELQAAGIGQTEISLGSGTERRDYQLEVSPLKDWRGLKVGSLLLLQDVTGQKRAQAQILEQQRALAMLHERERLARELHDSLGQVLGYAGFQVDAASKLVQDGQSRAATAQLERLAEVVREAHADVREHILNLSAAPAPGQPFIPALRHYLEGFSHNYAIQTLLKVDERLGDEPFPPDDQMQILRILQEALSNTRKHGQAHCVHVTFALEEQLVRLTIQDDGSGFDPTQAAGEGHFGLKFMRDRADELGGKLRLESSPGEGTRLILEIPENLLQRRQDAKKNQ